MTAREFLDAYRYDERLVTGGYVPQEPVAVDAGDRIGVVLLNLGGPQGSDEIAPFLYERLMDPASLDLPMPAMLRDRFSRFAARRRATALEREYEQIGGSSPLMRHVREQACAIQQRLNARFGPATGATFTTYVAMRYGQSATLETLAQMQQDGIDKVVLLPLYPQYAKSTTGASLAYWDALAQREAAPTWPTSLVYEYATHPKLVQALAERIDEGLQRFPPHLRDRVTLVFSAQGAPLKDLTRRRDPYCCLVHSTVQQVMGYREALDPGRSFHVSFQETIGPGKSLTPSTSDTLESLADEGHTAVLVIPASFVSDHLATAYTLDIARREEARSLGIEQYEVTSGLNCHPLFIEALAECVAAQVTPIDVARGDGADVLPSALTALPRYKTHDRTVRCHQCPFVCEAHDWTSQPAVHVPAPRRAVASAAHRTA